jgi:hypothetical protein
MMSRLGFTQTDPSVLPRILADQRSAAALTAAASAALYVAHLQKEDAAEAEVEAARAAARFELGMDAEESTAASGRTESGDFGLGSPRAV